MFLLSSEWTRKLYIYVCPIIIHTFLYLFFLIRFFHQSFFFIFNFFTFRMSMDFSLCYCVLVLFSSHYFAVRCPLRLFFSYLKPREWKVSKKSSRSPFASLPFVHRWCTVQQFFINSIYDGYRFIGRRAGGGNRKQAWKMWPDKLGHGCF